MGKSRKKQTGDRNTMTDREMRRYVFLLLIPGIVILVAVTVLISGALGKSSPGAASSQTQRGSIQTLDPEEMPVIEPDTKQYFQDFGGSILTRDGEEAVTRLMEQYFQSITDCDMETFLNLFTSRDMSEEEKFRREFEQQKQYIEVYQNISCYTTPGIEDGEFAAYVYYEIRYLGVETPAPGLVRIYAVPCEDGQYRIYDGEISEELSEYLEQLSENEDVRLLSSQVDQQMAAAMEADPALKERVEFMKNGPAYMQEEP